MQLGLNDNPAVMPKIKPIPVHAWCVLITLTVI